MAPIDRKRPNIHQIVQMFTNLGLPVCDDEEAIRKKRDEQRGTRNRELNSTKGTVVAKAQQWFDDVNALLNKREELLELLYEDFCLLGDGVLRADLDGGRTSVGMDTVSSLRDIALIWCRARRDLADRWVRRYLEQHGLREGGEIQKPRLVEDLRLRLKGGRVQITWTMPSDRCDEVLVLRATDPPTEDDKLVFRGVGSSFLDGDVVPGQHYVYRVFSLHEGRRSLSSGVATTRGARGSLAPSPSLLSLAAAALVLALGGVVWVRYGDTLLDAARPFAASLQQADAATPGTVTPVAGGDEPAGLEEALPVSSAAEAAPPLTSPEPTPPPEPEKPALEARLVAPPSIAFAGYSLRVDLELSEPVRLVLVDPLLSGLQVKRLDLDEQPPSIRFNVDTLPQGEDQGRVSWSFRLVTHDGRISDPVEGSCMVLPSG